MTVRETRHVGIAVSDVARSLRFYGEYLGLKPFLERPDQTGTYISTVVGLPDCHVDIYVLQAPDGSKVELLKYHSHPEPPGRTARACESGRPHIAFTVDDIFALYESRDAFGVVFENAPVRSPDDDVYVAYCHDPDGVILELVQPFDAAP